VRAWELTRGRLFQNGTQATTTWILALVNFRSAQIASRYVLTLTANLQTHKYKYINLKSFIGTSLSSHFLVAAFLLPDPYENARSISLWNNWSSCNSGESGNRASDVIKW
jgi:hypothetical protein